MNRPDFISVPPDLRSVAEAALRENPSRVQRIALRGQFYWLKSAENLTLRMRLQKGDPLAAFAAEREGLHALAEAGAPVPPILAEGPSYFVTPHIGQPLDRMLKTGAPEEPERLRAFRAAAEALAALHAKGLSHGRPSIKDICWDGARAGFLDAERYSEKRNNFAGHVEDLMILVFSAFATTRGPTPETDILAQTYRACDPGGIWEGARRRARRLAWTGPLSWPIRRFMNAPEFDAIPLTLKAFSAHLSRPRMAR
jgi:hypothetical protein